mgnify:CR=1 FL=1
MEITDLPNNLLHFGPLVCWEAEDEGHFYLLYDIFHDGTSLVYITGDPSSGIIYQDEKQFSSQWSGRALVTSLQAGNRCLTEQLEQHYRRFSSMNRRLFGSGVLR